MWVRWGLAAAFGAGLLAVTRTWAVRLARMCPACTAATGSVPARPRVRSVCSSVWLLGAPCLQSRMAFSPYLAGSSAEDSLAYGGHERQVLGQERGQHLGCRQPRF